ncbi:hypothetical protein [Synechococcus sp. CS-1332]|uniref:hypothetical protein n=1 Tax=Synechococcus sp. CS-1332 TaxID=2847972 RepID=UPI00223BC4BB|nr:hypothetical protein [Synechococcus sp. CS-1332]
MNPEIGEFVWESCHFEDLVVNRGNLTRAEAWISEQFSLHVGQRWRQAVPKLQERRWGGYTETFFVPTPEEENELIELVEGSVCMFCLMGMAGLELGIKHLALSDEARGLYQARVQQIIEHLLATAEDELAAAIAISDKQKIQYWQQRVKVAEYYLKHGSFTLRLPEDLRFSGEP